MISSLNKIIISLDQEYFTIARAQTGHYTEEQVVTMIYGVKVLTLLLKGVCWVLLYNNIHNYTYTQTLQEMSFGWRKNQLLLC